MDTRVLVSQLCQTFRSPVHGISQARILEWVPIPFSGDLPDSGIKPRSPALQADSLPSEPPEKPLEEWENAELSIGRVRGLTREVAQDC